MIHARKQQAVCCACHLDVTSVAASGYGNRDGTGTDGKNDYDANTGKGNFASKIPGEESVGGAAFQSLGTWLYNAVVMLSYMFWMGSSAVII